MPERAQAKLAGLLDCGIRTVINLMEVDEVDHERRPFADYACGLEELGRRRGLAVTTYRLPIRDLGTPSAAQMQQILDKIDASMAAGRPVYVHCWGGIGRTGTVIGCWLARHGRAQGEAALMTLATLRIDDEAAARPSPETYAQREFVLGWEEGK
jgi:hypothetical protein